MGKAMKESKKVRTFAHISFKNIIAVMKNILVIGSTGQIGSELTMELRKRYGNEHVVAGYIVGAEPQGELLESGPSARANVTDRQSLEMAVKEYHIDTGGRKPPLDGLENRHRRLVECAGSGTRARMRRLHTQLHRLLRRIHAPYQDPAGHRPAPPHDVWHHQGDHRTAERLLLY